MKDRDGEKKIRREWKGTKREELEGWTAGVGFPARTKFFSSPQRPNRLGGPSLASYLMGTGGCFLGV
jgi:hypothetical protein